MMGLVKWFQRHRWLVRAGQFLLVAVPLALLFQSLLVNWQAIQAYEWQFDVIRSTAAVLCLVAAFGLLPVASQQALAGLGYSIDYSSAYRAYFVAQVAKYLPGGLWIVPGRALVLGRIGVNVVSSSAGIVIELCLLLLAGILVSLPYALSEGPGLLSRTWALGLLAIPVVLVMLHPRLFNPLMRWLMARVGQEDVPANVTARRLATIALTDLVFWLVTGLGFGLLISSVYRLPLNLWLALPSIFSIAWVVGFLAFLTPGGLGVREGVLALLLAPILPAPLPAVVALLARVWWTLAELISLGITVLVARDASRVEVGS